jgi:hypothetical protein
MFAVYHFSVSAPAKPQQPAPLPNQTLIGHAQTSSAADTISVVHSREDNRMIGLELAFQIHLHCL